MAGGDKIETRSHILGFREEISKASSVSRDRFLTWFDDAKDGDTACTRGAWDFSCHIAAPLTGLLKSPAECTAIEIGSGGGRVLAAAARHFKTVIGVDIHEHNDLVRAELDARGIKNATLLRGDGKSLPVGDGAADVVYSFIVLQHVEKFSIFGAYVHEAARVLKPGGLAVLYFGRWQWLSRLKPGSWRIHADRLLERIRLPAGFEETPAVVNEINLRVSLPKAKAVAKSAGFEVLKTLTSRRRVPDDALLPGAQHGLVLRWRQPRMPA
ncbi:MAG: class I SAM-dependent methyltransferase [Terrimicrobiaceae bacterium]